MKKIIALFLAASLWSVPVGAQDIRGPQPSAVGVSAVGQVPGSSTNDSASSGNVGEYPTPGTVTGGSAISLTTSTSTNITTISLPSGGDYDVSGLCAYTGGTTTTIQRLICSVSTTSATLATGGTTARTENGFPASYVPLVNGDQSLVVAPTRIS